MKLCLNAYQTEEPTHGEHKMVILQSLAAPPVLVSNTWLRDIRNMKCNDLFKMLNPTKTGCELIRAGCCLDAREVRFHSLSSPATVPLPYLLVMQLLSFMWHHQIMHASRRHMRTLVLVTSGQLGRSHTTFTSLTLSATSVERSIRPREPHPEDRLST